MSPARSLVSPSAAIRLETHFVSGAQASVAPEAYFDTIM